VPAPPEVKILALAALGACSAPNPAYRPAGDFPDALLGEDRLDAPARTPDLPFLSDARGPDASAPPDDLGGPVLPDAAWAPDAGTPGDLRVPRDAAPDRTPDAPNADVPPAPLPGLVAHWRLDRAAGSTIADDTGANPGMLIGSAAWSDLGFDTTRFSNRGSLQLGGGNGAARLGNATLPALERPKTISLWLWINAPSTSQRETILSFSNPGRSRSIQIGLEGGRIAVWTWNRAIGGALLYAPAPAGSGWHHVGYTYDAGKHTLYLLGTNRSATWTPEPAPITDALLGAFDVNDPQERFVGRIDDVRVYDRALDSTLMAQLAAGAP